MIFLLHMKFCQDSLRAHETGFDVFQMTEILENIPVNQQSKT